MTQYFNFSTSLKNKISTCVEQCFSADGLWSQWGHQRQSCCEALQFSLHFKVKKIFLLHSSDTFTPQGQVFGQPLETEINYIGLSLLHFFTPIFIINVRGLCNFFILNYRAPTWKGWETSVWSNLLSMWEIYFMFYKWTTADPHIF